jgi:hypothetical protein
MISIESEKQHSTNTSRRVIAARSVYFIAPHSHCRRSSSPRTDGCPTPVPVVPPVRLRRRGRSRAPDPGKIALRRMTDVSPAFGYLCPPSGLWRYLDPRIIMTPPQLRCTEGVEVSAVMIAGKVGRRVIMCSIFVCTRRWCARRFCRSRCGGRVPHQIHTALSNHRLRRTGDPRFTLDC